MKSIYLFFLVYILIAFYGNTITDYKADITKKNAIFENNQIYLISEIGEEKLQLNCSNMQIIDLNDIHCRDVDLHIEKDIELQKIKSKSVQKDGEQRSFKVEKDVFLRSGSASFYPSKNTLNLDDGVDLTYGTASYLKTKKAIWGTDTNLIHFPEQVFLQDNKDLFKGTNGSFNLETMEINFEKDIKCQFKPKNDKIKNQEQINITSIGPLKLNRKKRIIEFENTTKIENDKYHLTAGKITIYFNESDELQNILAEKQVKLKVINKDLYAQSEVAKIDNLKHTYELITSNNKKPFVDINGFRQTAETITYDEKNDILNAGPTVRSVKIEE